MNRRNSPKNYGKMKISSIGASTALEISTASLREGLYWAFSSRMMVSLRTQLLLGQLLELAVFFQPALKIRHGHSSPPSSSWSARS